MTLFERKEGAWKNVVVSAREVESAKHVTGLARRSRAPIAARSAAEQSGVAGASVPESDRLNMDIACTLSLIVGKGATGPDPDRARRARAGVVSEMPMLGKQSSGLVL